MVSAWRVRLPEGKAEVEIGQLDRLPVRRTRESVARRPGYVRHLRRQPMAAQAFSLGAEQGCPRWVRFGGRLRRSRSEWASSSVGYLMGEHTFGNIHRTLPM
jgi:hypothetical protein